MDLMEQNQREDTKMIRGLEYLSYEDRLRAEVVQPGKQGARETLSHLPVPQGAIRRLKGVGPL